MLHTRISYRIFSWGGGGGVVKCRCMQRVQYPNVAVEATIYDIIISKFARDSDLLGEGESQCAPPLPFPAPSL